MKTWQRISFCTVLALLTLWPVGGAFGATVSGRASTELEWYDDADEDTATPAYQYLLLNIKDLGAEGWNFRGYGRLADDLSDEVDVDSRLYYGYLEKNDLLTNLDLRLGRQFISTAAGASLMDGIRLQYRNLGPLAVELFGGGDVSYYEGYNAEDLVGGIEVRGKFADLSLDISYLQKRDDSELGEELFGLEAEYDFRNLMQLYTEVQYDYISDRLSYFLGGFNYYRHPKWSLRGEYVYSLPVFSSMNIFSVFAAGEYEEIMGELNYHINTGLRAFGRITNEMYEEDYGDAQVYEVGIEKIRTGRFSGYLVGTYRNDEDGQDLKGVKVRAAYLLGQSLEAGLGAHIDTLERRLDEDEDETTSSRIWADATYYLSKTVNVQGKVERIESDFWDYYYRGRVRLNIYF